MLKDKVRVFLYNCYCRRLKRKNKNKTPTLLCNTCVGGMLYHQLGLKFLSPTINCKIANNDFVEFVNNFNDYIRADLVDKSDTNTIKGMLKNKNTNQEIFINFVHDDSFGVASDNWNRRKKRINYNDIYIIFDCTYSNFILDNQLLSNFKKIPYKKVMLVSTMGASNYDKYNDIFYIHVSKKLKGVANATSCVYWGYYKYFNRFNFIKWLNKR